MKKIAIIGSNSFSGSHCVNYFLGHSAYKILGLSRSPEKMSLFLPYLYKKQRPPASRFVFHQLDLNEDMDEIIRLLDKERPEVIINFAAQSIVENSWEQPEDWFRTNCLSLVNLTHHLRNKTYLKNYLQISTPEVYGSYNARENLNYFNPTTPYAASKGAGDLFLVALYKKFGFPVSFVRSANVYGPHQQLFKIIPKAVISIKSHKKIPLHQGGMMSRSFIHIEDVMRGIHKIVLKGSSGGEVYHFSSWKNVTIRDLVSRICEQMGVRFADSVEISAGRPGQDATYRLLFADTRKKLKWEPKIELKQGVDEVITWIDESWDLIKKCPKEYIHKR